MQHHAAAWQPRRLPDADLLQSQLSNAGSQGRRLTLAVPGAPNLTSITSVLDWGAVGDGHTDNTAAFRAALDSVSNGGIVFVPAGQYSFDGSLSMPTATSLVGTYVTVPSHEVDQGAQAPTDGSILMPRGGRGSENGSAFISVTEDCTLKGFTIFYPDQAPNAAPAPYPWTIAMSGNNAAVQDVELLNPWNGISAVGAARHYIARVQGQPANIGIFVDETYDIGRIENVHWNPWYSVNAAYIAHQTVFGQGFVFARTDWEYVLNTFVFAMSVGYRFVESPTGSCNGNFLGIGADCCQNASVLVDAADPWGILITNGGLGGGLFCKRGGSDELPGTLWHVPLAALYAVCRMCPYWTTEPHALHSPRPPPPSHLSFPPCRRVHELRWHLRPRRRPAHADRGLPLQRGRCAREQLGVLGPLQPDRQHSGQRQRGV